jgi:hypothetical protein
VQEATSTEIHQRAYAGEFASKEPLKLRLPRIYAPNSDSPGSWPEVM